MRWAIVASGTRNARAIWAVVRPPTARSVSATCEAGESAGWQHRNSSVSVSSSSGLDRRVRRQGTQRLGRRAGPRRSPRGGAAPSRRGSRRSGGAPATVISQPRGLSGTPCSGHWSGGGQQRLLDRVLAGVELAVAPERARRGPAARARAAGPRRSAGVCHISSPAPTSMSGRTSTMSYAASGPENSITRSMLSQSTSPHAGQVLLGLAERPIGHGRYAVVDADGLRVRWVGQAVNWFSSSPDFVSSSMRLKWSPMTRSRSVARQGLPGRRVAVDQDDVLHSWLLLVMEGRCGPVIWGSERRMRSSTRYPGGGRARRVCAPMSRTARPLRPLVERCPRTGATNTSIDRKENHDAQDRRRTVHLAGRRRRGTRDLALPVFQRRDGGDRRRRRWPRPTRCCWDAGPTRSSPRTGPTRAATSNSPTR